MGNDALRDNAVYHGCMPKQRIGYLATYRNNRGDEAGDVAQIKPSVDKKMTFLELFNGAYAVEVAEQLSAGERPVLYAGKIII